MRKTLIIILLLVLVSLSLRDKGNVGNESHSLNTMDITVTSKITATNAIVSITNDSVLASYALSGNGTSNFPYILGNFAINNCTSYDTGISITNTTKNFVLTNVSVSGCFFGIDLYEVSFGSIVNSTVSYSSSVAISLNKTSYSVVNNISISNSWSGISLRQSTFNNITNTFGTFFNTIGLSLSNSSYNNVFNNSISNSPDALYGIRLSDYSNHNKLLNNTVTIANGLPIDIESSSFNTIFNNTISGNFSADQVCLQLIDTSNNTISNNMISYCIVGLRVNTSSYTLITNNTVLRTKIGIELASSSANTINFNVINSANVLGGTIHGISLTNSFTNTVYSNKLYNIFDGIVLQGSTYNNLTNNLIISVNNVNFYLSNSNNNYLINNTVSNPTETVYSGFYIVSSNNNTLFSNSVEVQGGIEYLVSLSSFNTFSHNTGLNSLDSCFQVINSLFTTLMYNYISNCSLGIGIQSSNRTVITANTILNSNIGIEMISSSENTIAFNAINITFFSLDSTTGIILYQTMNSSISSNVLYNNQNGFNITDSNTISLSNNVANSITGYNFYNYNSNSNYFYKNTVYNPFGIIEAGFFVKSATNVTLLENSVLAFNGPAYYLSSSNNNDIKLNYGNTQGNCFQLENLTYTSLENNTAEYCSVGMYIHNSNNNTFTNNTVSNSNVGFQLLSSSSNTFINNYGSNNTASDYQDLSQLSNTLTNNYFTSNSTNSSLTASIGPNTGSSGTGMFGIPNITLPELTVISLIALTPFVGLFAYRKLSGKKKGKISLKDLQTDFSYDKSTPLRLMFLGPFIGLFATIYYSNKHRNLDYFSLKSNELRGNILTILEEQHFIHFNKLREYLNCGVSILKWHIQVLNEFKIVNWSKIGQYKVIYLVEKPPAIKEVNLFYSMSNDNVIQILEEFLKMPTWRVDTLANKSLLRKDSVMHHCKKLADIKILKENKSTHEFMLPPSTKELVRKILFKKVYYNSKNFKRTAF